MGDESPLPALEFFQLHLSALPLARLNKLMYLEVRGPGRVEAMVFTAVLRNMVEAELMRRASLDTAA